MEFCIDNYVAFTLYVSLCEKLNGYQYLMFPYLPPERTCQQIDHRCENLIKTVLWEKLSRL